MGYVYSLEVVVVVVVAVLVVVVVVVAASTVVRQATLLETALMERGVATAVVPLGISLVTAAQCEWEKPDNNKTYTSTRVNSEMRYFVL